MQNINIFLSHPGGKGNLCNAQKKVCIFQWRLPFKANRFTSRGCSPIDFRPESHMDREYPDRPRTRSPERYRKRSGTPERYRTPERSQTSERSKSSERRETYGTPEKSYSGHSSSSSSTKYSRYEVEEKRRRVKKSKSSRETESDKEPTLTAKERYTRWVTHLTLHLWSSFV